MSLQKINVNSTDLGVVHTGDIVADPQRKWEQGTAEEYIDSEVAKERERAQTSEENLKILYNNLQQSQPIPVTALPATGEAGKIYRLAGTTSYADYMYKEGALTTPIKMAEYDNAIDDVPTAGSNNLAKSGGVFEEINKINLNLDYLLLPAKLVNAYVNNPDGKLMPHEDGRTAIFDISNIETVYMYASELTQAPHYAFWTDINGQNVIGNTYHHYNLGNNVLNVPIGSKYLGVCYSWRDDKPLSIIKLGNNLLAFNTKGESIINRINDLESIELHSLIGYGVNYITGKLEYSGRLFDKCAVFNVNGRNGIFLNVSDSCQCTARFYSFWKDNEGQDIVNGTSYTFEKGITYIPIPTDAKYFAINYSYYTDGDLSLNEIKVIFDNDAECFSNLSLLQEFTMRENLVWNAIGDSLTELNDNTNAQQSGWCKRGFISRVCDKIKNLSYINNGHSGETISDTENRSYGTADVYTIFFGQNDWNQNKILGNKTNFDSSTYDGTVMGSLGALIAKIRTISNSPIIVMSPIESGVACMRVSTNVLFPSDTPNTQGWTIADMAEMERLCLENNDNNVIFADIHSLSMISKRNTNSFAYVNVGGNIQKVAYPDYLQYIDIPGEVPQTLFQNDCNYMTYDGCHYSDLGAQAIANPLIKFIEKALNVVW